MGVRCRMFLLVAVAGCPHPSGSVPTTVVARAKITTATAWLAGDLDGAEDAARGAGGDPRALALLARAYAIAGKPAEAQRAVRACRARR